MPDEYLYLWLTRQRSSGRTDITRPLCPHGHAEFLVTYLELMNTEDIIYYQYYVFFL